MSMSHEPYSARRRGLWFSLAVLIAIALVVAGCSDDDDGDNAMVTVSGIVATGHALVNATVVIVNGRGTMSTPVMTDANGAFTVDIEAPAPLLIRAVSEDGQLTLYSYVATITGNAVTVHITGLTDLVIKLAAGVANLTAIFDGWGQTQPFAAADVESASVTIIANLANEMHVAGLRDLEQIDLFSDPDFAANGEGLDAVLDALVTIVVTLGDGGLVIEITTPTLTITIDVNIGFDDVVVDTLADSRLQLLHASDLEGGVDAVGDAPNFAAVVEALEQDASGPSILISAGDNYIPGPFFSAAGDGSLRPVFQGVHDTLFGLPEGSLNNIREAGGRADVTIMNIIGFDASALGNHEFDAGTAVVSDIIGTDIRGDTLGDVRWLGAQFPYLSANLDFSGDGNLSGLFTDQVLPNTAFQSTPDDLGAAGAAPKIAPYTIIDLGNGERAAVIGGTTPKLDSITSPGGVQVREPGAGSDDMAALASILQPAIDTARQGDDGALGTADDIDKIILVTHLQQISLEEELIPLLSGVDIAVAGGGDTLLANNTERLRTGDTADRAYPIVTTNLDGDPALIVSTPGEYAYVGRLVVDFDANGVLLADHLNSAVNDAYPTDSNGVQSLWGDLDAPFADGTKGAQVKRLTDAIEGVVTDKDGNVFGRSLVFLEGRRDFVRTEETNLGNLTADANLAMARQTDAATVISIKNGGGIRAEIGFIDGDTGELLPTQANALSGKEAGQISQLDIENSLRFNNGLTLLTVTAQELKTLAEHAVAASEPGDTPGQFPQVAGLRFSFDPQMPARQTDDAGAETQPGERIRSLAVVDPNGFLLDRVVEAGQVVGDAARTFRIVTLNFMADGGDDYPFPDRDRVDLAQADEAARTGAATFAPDGSEQDAMAEHLAANFADTPFGMAETPPSGDERIQDLSQRADTVFDILPAPLVSINTGVFDGPAAEISAFDASSNRLFIVNGSAETVEVYDVSNPSNPQPLSALAVGGAPNSVAAHNGLIAVAVQADPATDPGSVKFFNANGDMVGDVTVGVLPDMVAFTPDGSKALVANEGEPNDDYTVDPEGTVSIIDTATFQVMTADFAAFNDKVAMLRNRGVRIFGPGASVAQDLEPEYIAVTPDGSTAAVTLQENNAVAIVDIATATVVDIIALGFKDYSRGAPQVQNIPFDNLPVLGATAGGQDILLGGFSGLWFDGMDDATGNYRFLTVPDRGPNPDTLDVDNDGVNERPFALPDYQARVVPFEVNPGTGALTMQAPIFLFRSDGVTPITGLPNLPNDVDEQPVDLFGAPLAFDEFGGDLEGILRSPAGDFWMVDEYRPAIYHFDGDLDGDGASSLIARYVPAGTAALVGQAAGTFGQETLPAVYANRRANRGFEGMALDTDAGILYAFIQTPLDNPDDSIRHSDVIRILGINPADGAPVREYLYLLERNRERGVDEGRVDKIGDAVYDPESGRMFVIERDSGTTATSKKYIFEIDFSGASDLLAAGAPTPLAGLTLEQHTADQLAEAGIRPVHKRRVLNLPSVGYLGRR